MRLSLSINLSLSLSMGPRCLSLTCSPHPRVLFLSFLQHLLRPLQLTMRRSHILPLPRILVLRVTIYRNPSKATLVPSQRLKTMVLQFLRKAFRADDILAHRLRPTFKTLEQNAKRGPSSRVLAATLVKPL